MSKKIKIGLLEVICGPMFSGKSEELMRRLRRAKIAQQNIAVFKHSLDKRTIQENVVSHDGNSIEASAISQIDQLIDYTRTKEYDVIGIDEVQFFSATIIPVIMQLIDQGTRVIVAGLDLDFKRTPFGPMPTLLALACTVTKLQAICSLCGQEACFTQRLINNKPAQYTDPLILIGAQENYQARCKICYHIDQLPYRTLHE